MQKILGARDEHERKGKCVRGFGRGSDALGRVREIVDRARGIAGRIFDRCADETDLGCETDGLRRILGRVSVAVLEIGGDGEMRRVDDRLRIRERIIARDGAVAVAAAEHEGEAGAGGGERVEAEPREDARGAGVPRIGDDERARARVQRLECLRLLGLRCVHGHHGGAGGE